MKNIVKHNAGKNLLAQSSESTGIGSTWLWYVCVAVCNNNFKRKHDLCQAQHLFGNDMK